MSEDQDKGRAIEVLDEGRKRWYKGKVLYVVRIGDDDKPDAWMVELRNGNRGAYDKAHVRWIGEAVR